MVVLGLGTNVGDRLAHLRKAYAAIQQLEGVTVQQVSPVYLSDALLPDNAPAEWDMPHLNLALACECALTPPDLLRQIKNIEYAMGRQPDAAHWGPRIIDIDILAWDELVLHSDTLTIPHQHLTERPFALWPLADVAPLWTFPLPGAKQGKTAAQLVEDWGSRFAGTAPMHTRQVYQRIDMPQLVGILNVTPDSFSDGGQFLSVEKAVEQALHLVSSGAEIIDIGAESTAPHASLMTAEAEWTRLEPVLNAIRAASNDFLIAPKISVDTRHADTASKALKAGADWINDVSGLQEAAMREIVAASRAYCVVMHHLSIPASRDHVLPRHVDAVKQVIEWAEKQLELLTRAGIAKEKIIFDPGIGFGKSPEQSLALIKNITAFKTLDTRLLIGHSRKSFLSLFTPYPPADRDVESLAVSLYLAKQPVDYLRLHHVEWCARGFRVMGAL